MHGENHWSSPPCIIIVTLDHTSAMLVLCCSTTVLPLSPDVEVHEVGEVHFVPEGNWGHPDGQVEGVPHLPEGVVVGILHVLLRHAVDVFWVFRYAGKGHEVS